MTRFSFIKAQFLNLSVNEVLKQSPLIKIALAHVMLVLNTWETKKISESIVL